MIRSDRKKKNTGKNKARRLMRGCVRDSNKAKTSLFIKHEK